MQKVTTKDTGQQKTFYPVIQGLGLRWQSTSDKVSANSTQQGDPEQRAPLGSFLCQAEMVLLIGVGGGVPWKHTALAPKLTALLAAK